MPPFIEKLLEENVVERTFDKKVTQEELEWHYDEESRIIELISGEGWFLQFTEGEPIYLESNKSYEIPKEVFHRLVKSPDAEDLVVKISKHK